MKSLHLVIPDLFLPNDMAAEASRGLKIPVLEKMLCRGRSEILEPVSLEILLCELFGIQSKCDAPISPISAAFDGLDKGCWMRADPVHLHLQRDQMLMVDVQVGSDEAEALCVSLNDHFSGQGMEFFAPHPLRWYVRLNEMPHMSTTPHSQVIGRDVRRFLPTGDDASKWHQIFNEIQMLFFAHPLYEAREARGELPINSVWFWGAGDSANVSPQGNYSLVSSDEILPEMFAMAAGVPFSSFQDQWRDDQGMDRQLLVRTALHSAFQRGDLTAWRDELNNLENRYLQPIWDAIRAGRVEQLQVDILSGNKMHRIWLSHRDTWAFWRQAKPLASYSLV